VANGGVCRVTDMEICGEDIVLGVQWLRTLGSILWDFDNLTMSFWCDERMVRWTGMGSMAPCCNTLSAPRDLLEALLESFTDIFAEPCGLPPLRRHGHHIRLLPRMAPVAV
jgi:hypothetical protein